MNIYIYIYILFFVEASESLVQKPRRKKLILRQRTCEIVSFSRAMDSGRALSSCGSTPALRKTCVNIYLCMNIYISRFIYIYTCGRLFVSQKGLYKGLYDVKQNYLRLYKVILGSKELYRVLYG